MDTWSCLYWLYKGVDGKFVIFTGHKKAQPEAEFLDVIGTKILRIFLLAIHSHLYYGFYSAPLEQKWFIVDKNLQV